MPEPWYQQEVNRLATLLNEVERGTLAVALYDDSALQELLMGGLRPLLQRPVHEIELSPEFPSLLTLMKQGNTGPGQIVSVRSLEAGGQPALNELEYRREALFDTRVNLLLWVTARERDLLLKEAPNFYSRRALLAQFGSEAESAEELFLVSVASGASSHDFSSGAGNAFVRKFGGKVERTSDNRLVLSFLEAKPAVCCAREILSTGRRGAAARGLEVPGARIVVHYGRPQRSEGRLTGLDVEKLDRLAELAKPGQALLSSAAYPLVRPSPDEFDLYSHGVNAIPDLGEEEIYEVLSPGDFPQPLRKAPFVEGRPWFPAFATESDEKPGTNAIHHDGSRAMPLTILHLSDLQFGRHHRYPKDKDPYQTLYSKLSEDLDRLAEEHGLRPNALVVTGDIAESSMPDEYQEARDFLDKLRGKLNNLAKDRIVLVPGNHDINRDLCHAARLQAKATATPFDEPCFAKFGNYQDFFNDFYDGVQFFDASQLSHVFRFDEEKVLIAGLNSCLKESELKKDHYGWIGLTQVRQATARCKEIDPDFSYLRIAALHHNFLCGSDLDHENLRDADEIRPSLEKGHFHFILHGHQHIAGAEKWGRASSRTPITIVATGSAGLDQEALPEHPNQYQLIKIEDRDAVTLHMRQYSAKTFRLGGRGAFIADASQEESGIVRFELGWEPCEAVQPSSVPRLSLREAKTRFLTNVREQHRFLPLKGFGMDMRVPLELQPVYVGLRAVPTHLELEARGARERAPERLEEMGIGQALTVCEEQGYSGLVVLGDPGSGKTTLLKYLALCLASPKPPRETGIKPGRVPVFLPLRYVRDFTKPIEEALGVFYPMAQWELPADFFRRLLDSEPCLILLDGLDEVATAEKRKKALEWVENERQRGRGHPILVTSRFAGYKGTTRLPSNYLELRVSDFNDQDVEKFIRQWYHQVEAKQRSDSPHWHDEARRLSDDLHGSLRKPENANLSELAHNPLMLQIICLVHRSQGSMPKRRTELYEACIKVLLEYWDKAKELDIYLNATEARRVLRPLALWLHEEEGRTYADEEDVKRILLPHLAQMKRELKDVEQQLDRLLTSVRDRSGLFVGFDIARYGFQHLSFQEFLAAEEIAKRGEHERLVETFGQTWWREPTLLAVGLDDPQFQEAFFEALLKSEGFPNSLQLALDCVREALAPTMAPFIQALKNEKLPLRNRNGCALLLRELGGPEAVRALETVVDESLPELASVAADALVQLGAAAGAQVVGKDGSELIAIPAGEFLMGTDRGGQDHERPQRRVRLDAYQIARHPVTNAQYRRFIEATKHREPYYWDDKHYNKPNQPVVGVTWEDAQAYCEWAGLRLPTEAEWEKAARGTDGRTWPWGDELPDEGKCNFNNNVDAPTEIASYPDSASPYGCHDMAGNVWEWCSDWYGDYRRDETRNPEGPNKGSSRILRGGAYWSDTDGVRCASRLWFHPVYGYDFSFGFRCAR